MKSTNVDITVTTKSTPAVRHPEITRPPLNLVPVPINTPAHSRPALAQGHQRLLAKKAVSPPAKATGTPNNPEHSSPLVYPRPKTHHVNRATAYGSNKKTKTNDKPRFRKLGSDRSDENIASNVTSPRTAQIKSPGQQPNTPNTLGKRECPMDQVSPSNVHNSGGRQTKRLVSKPSCVTYLFILQHQRGLV